MAKKPIAIFRKKAEILIGRDMGNVIISDEVIQNEVFIKAKMTDTLGFKVLSGSDYTVVDVIEVQGDPKAFLKLAFGEREEVVVLENPASG